MRIMDAAERVFARGGYDGASIREIAAEAGVQVALINHHGGSKEALFWRVVARRSDDLSAARIAALEKRKAAGPLSVADILTCFFAPYLDRAADGDPQWKAYARLVAFVSADARWRQLAETCFDPTAHRFVDELAALFPPEVHMRVASGFIFSVAAMLALLTSEWRMNALGDNRDALTDRFDELVTFCAAGITAATGI
ncbi:TetR/AcrR family transcriptional regulator [Shimia sp. R11_0]|uniref:TetR/AcrR family transcriptional regulator n=1 Tax=Shimia sp. R11_0 TaxID=2821096 RepID=UPI001FFDF5BB|nr:TetR/AcrR family transcriptional regulator [Shimia sp. R11_0]